MEILHMMGHNSKWNLDLHFKNGIGSGFIFGAYSFPAEYFGKKINSGYLMEKILPKSLIDFQFYGKKESAGSGKFSTYHFHTANVDPKTSTSVYIYNSIYEAVEYQEELGLTKIIIPCPYENFKLDDLLLIIRQVNKWLNSRRLPNIEYYMTIPVTNHMVIDDVKMEAVLVELTSMHICFDGFYIVCETKPENRHKISIELKYLINMSRFLKVLKKQDFKLIYAYANWDVVVLFAQVDIDYISIGTFEVLRNFNIKRFQAANERGGPSEGWYFSDKLLNLMKAQYVTALRDKGSLDLVENDSNIYSDVILDNSYKWSNMKPEVHQNYVVAVSELLSALSKLPAGKPRVDELLNRIRQAEELYDTLDGSGINFFDESSNYHLSTWKIFLTNW